MRQVNIMIIDNEVPSESNNPFPEDVLSEISEEGKEESLQPADHEESGESLPLPDNEGGAAEGKKRGGTPQFVKFLEAFEGNSSPEEKIRLSMEFMRGALVHQGAPRFRDFWEGRKLCLPLFRENLSPKARSQLWGEYIELSSEARRLKEILDEQSAFAVEQIELAIQAIERDIEHYDTMLTHVQEVTFPYPCLSLKKKQDFYNQLQTELLLLNTLAARINGLRKEVVKTEMRIRTKNKLFERLSLCGDRVFPRRKELIKTISQEFTQDIEQFVTSHFGEQDQQGVPLYALREEIKALQSMAKVLTLNTHSFTETRLKLSGCWDKLKDLEKDRKKEIAHKKQAFKQSFDATMEKISALAEMCKGEITLEEANRQASDIAAFMRDLELGRDEVRILKEELANAKRPIADKAREEENERQRKEREVEVSRREKINAIKEQLQELISHPEKEEVDQFIAKRDQLLQEFEAVAMSKAERQIIERQFKQLKDLVNERKERLLMDLSEDDLKSLEQLKEMLGGAERASCRDQESARKLPKSTRWIWL